MEQKQQTIQELQQQNQINQEQDISQEQPKLQQHQQQEELDPQTNYENQKQQQSIQLNEHRQQQESYLQDIQNLKDKMKQLDQSLSQSQNRIEQLEQKSFVNDSTLNQQSQSKISLQAQQIKDQMLQQQQQEESKLLQNSKNKFYSQQFQSDQVLTKSIQQWRDQHYLSSQINNNSVQIKTEPHDEYRHNKVYSQQQLKSDNLHNYLSDQQYNNQSLQTDIDINNNYNRSLQLQSKQRQDSLQLLSEMEERKIKEKELQYIQLKQEEYRQEQQFYEEQKQRYRQLQAEQELQFEEEQRIRKEKMKSQQLEMLEEQIQEKQQQLNNMSQISQEPPEIYKKQTTPFQKASIQISQKLREDELQQNLQTMKQRKDELEDYQKDGKNIQFSQSQQQLNQQQKESDYDYLQYTEPRQKNTEQKQVLQDVYNKAQKNLNDKEGVLNNSNDNFQYEEQLQNTQQKQQQGGQQIQNEQTLKFNQDKNLLYSQYSKEQLKNRTQQLNNNNGEIPQNFQESKKFSELMKSGSPKQIINDMRQFNNEADGLRQDISDKINQINNSPFKDCNKIQEQQKYNVDQNNRDQIENEIQELQEKENQDIDFLDNQGQYDQKKMMKNLEQDANLQQLIKEVKQRVGQNVYNPVKKVLNSNVEKFEKQKFKDVHEHFCEYRDYDKEEMDKRKKIIREKCIECQQLLNRGLSTKYCEKHGICYKKYEKQAMKNKLPKRLAQYI